MARRSEVLHARSVLAIPIHVDRSDVPSLARSMLSRHWGNSPEPIWEVDYDPERIQELEPAFARRLTSGSVPLDRSSTQELLRFRVTRAVVDLFADARIRAATTADVLTAPGPISIRLVVFPGGVGYVLWSMEWERTVCAELQVDQLASTLNAMRLLHGRPDIAGHAFHGLWGFANPLPEAFAKGWRGAAVSPFGAPHPTVTLEQVVRMLIGDGDGAVLRVTRSEYGFHQTALVLREPPDPLELDRALFLIGHALRPENEPPPAEHASYERWMPRGNRVMAASQEGVVSVSWPSEHTLDADNCFEVVRWPIIYDGILLALHLLARAERASLAELARDASTTLSELRFASPDALAEDPEDGSGDGVQQDDLDQKDIDKVLVLVRRSVGLAIQLVGDDCGGLTEYREFYRAVRRVLGTALLVEEVRTEVRELFDLASTIQARIRTRNTILQTELERHGHELDRTFQQRFSLLSIVAVCFAIVTGIYGMNLDDLPKPAWQWVVGGTGSLSIVAVSLFAYDYARRARRLKR